MDLPLILTKDIPFENQIIKFYVNENDSCIGSWLRGGHPWEAFMIPYFKQYVTDKSTIIDAGANIGTHSVYCGKLFPNCQIESFEPIPWIYNVLTKNLELNNITNCTTHNKGLGSEYSKFYSTPEVNEFTKNHNFGAFPLLETKKDDTCSEVDIVPLDYFNFQNVSLIKMDTEGHEINVLTGAINTIRQWKPTMIIEIDRKQMDNYKNLFEDEFISLGYKCQPISKHYDYLFTAR